MTPGKKALKGILIAMGLSFMITGIIVLWFGRDTILDLITEQKKSYDALSVGLDDMKPGDHVTVDVVLTEGYAIRKSESLGKGNTVSFSSETRYYLVYATGEEDGMEYLDHWVLVGKTGEFKKIEAAAKACQKWLDGEGERPTETVYSVEGRVVKLNKKEKAALKKYFDGEDYSEWLKPYVVMPLWSGWKSGKSGAVAMVVAGVIITVVNAIIVIIGLRIGKKAKKAQQA